jgi:hypothetical protein
MRKNRSPRSAGVRQADPLTIPSAAGSASGGLAADVPRRHAWRILGLCVVALAAYSNSFQSGMVFDNSAAILQDVRVHSATARNLDLILHEEYWYNSSTTGLYRPLTTFSYLVNYAVLGNAANPAGYHWVNLALHAANMLLVYWLGLLILQDDRMALGLAALWGLHPLLTESVTNIVGRADLLAAFGVLAGLLCHVAAASARGWRRAAWLAGVGVAAAIGIFSKENGALLPGVLLLYDLTWKSIAPWRKRAASYLAVAIPFAVYFALRGELHRRMPLGVVPVLDNPLIGADFWTAKLTAFKIIGKFLWLWIWPAHLSADYSYNAIPVFGWRLNTWEDLQALIAFAVCVACGILAIVFYRSRKALFFFIVFFFLTLAPTANLFLLIGTDMAERSSYLPSIGIAAACTLALHHAWRRFGARREVWLAAIGAIALAFGARTYARNFDWRDERSLWASAVQARPGSFKAHSLLAASLMEGSAADREYALMETALVETDRTLAILSGLPDADCTARPFASAGQFYRMKGDRVGGIGATPWYRKALAALERGDRVNAAEREHIREVNLAAGKKASVPPWPALYLELGRTLLRLSEPRKALIALAYGRPRGADPDYSAEIVRAGRAMDDWHRAAILLMERMVADPNASGLAPDLAELYRQAAPASCAVRNGAGQGTLDVTCPLVHEDVCAASRNVAVQYRQSGQTSKADATAGSAVRDLGCPAALFQ